MAHRYLRQAAYVDNTIGQSYNPAARAFVTALASNNDLAGDSCNRGALLGAVMGLVVGYKNIPQELVREHFRATEYQTLFSEFASMLSASKGGETVFARAGRSWPLLGKIKSQFRAPVDDPSKLRQIVRDTEILQVPMSAIRYLRDVGRVIIPQFVPCPDDTKRALALYKLMDAVKHFGRSAAIAVGPIHPIHAHRKLLREALDTGDAEADRLAVMAALNAGSNGVAANGGAVVGTPRWRSAGLVPESLRFLDPLPFSFLHPIHFDVGAAIYAGKGFQPGTGVFYFRNRADQGEPYE